MDTNNVIRAPTDNRPLSAGVVAAESPGPGQLPPRPPLNRADSRSAFPPVGQRPAAPLQAQPRPQFQPGGPVSGQPQFAPRPGPPLARGPAPPGPPQQVRAQPPPQRPSGPQSFAPQQGARPLQSPIAGQPPVRGFPPNNLQFGPRPGPQIAGAVTPDSARPPPQVAQLLNNGVARNGPPQNPASGQLSRQSSQGSIKGLETSNSYQNKTANLDNQGVTINQNVSKPENGAEMLGPKSRSYSIAAAPGAPSPLKMEDDRRKSVSSIGGRVEDYASRSPGLGLIQEGKIDSKENVRSTIDSVKSGITNDVERDMINRPESRISGSKMTDSFIGTLPTPVQKKRMDDDDDVVLQNSTIPAKVFSENSANQIKTDTFDRSPSLTRSDDSPELKQKPAPGLVAVNKSQSVTPEPQRPKTPKTEMKQEIKSEQIKESKTPPPSKIVPKSPVLESKPPVGMQKPTDLNTSSAADSIKSTPRRVASAPKSKPKDGDNDSGVDESTQGNDLNGSPGSPNKKTPSKLPTKEKSSSSLKPSLSRSSSKSATVKTPENPLPNEKKKVPMNKIQVGNAPSPNLKTVKSKIGSLDNATYKPGGGKVKIENRKLDFNKAAPKIAAKNETYTPSGGSKKITTTKLEWNAKSKIGSLQNASYKPGGGDKKIETVKLDFKDKAKPKVASTVNITHKPGGGAVKPTVIAKKGSRADHYYMSVHEWSEEPRPLTRCRSARTPRTPRAVSPRKYTEDFYDDRVERNNERNIERSRRASMARPATARAPLRSACARPTTLTQRPAFTIY
ncbi:microtubule-associated protein tau isoform X1 [Choristoneura fumiferana]|uniref:microtubule-associated protein tau isoform X1 n=1 Tax=Choristoneura fumiferana TaxID=7141 RepID=UPI003D15EA9A